MEGNNMRFTYENARLQHPQAGLIPKINWDFFFQGKLSNLEAELMQQSLTQIALHQEQINHFKKEKKIRLWICIALGHSEASGAGLMGLGIEVLALSHAELLYCAAAIGHAEVVTLLLDTPTIDEHISLLSYKSYAPFRYACENGHLGVTNQLLNAARPAIRQSMIAAVHYYAFSQACYYGRIAIFSRLIVEVDPEKREEMLSINDNFPLRVAYQNGHHHIINQLIHYACCFAYIDRHEVEFGQGLTHPFIDNKLNEFKQQRDLLARTNPGAIFDINDDEEAKLCFYIIRNLIRRDRHNMEESQRLLLEHDMTFLINIPAINALLHQAITQDFPNELYRLALSVNNHRAAALLFAIPTVRAVAEEHELYQDRGESGLTLRAIARDKESAMQTLSISEQSRLKQAMNAYKPFIEQSGVEQLMNDLRKQLIGRYKNDPAKLDTNDRAVILPYDWHTFDTMDLSKEERQLGLKAYYQNINHTALRYLSKPNYWMADQASYVYVDETNRTEKWSTFDEYADLIAMLWLAAQDVTRPPLPESGQTMKSRLDHFIYTLAEIGRAHNWDQSRLKTDSGRKIILNNENRPVKERFDDLEGDKPTCYSGVKGNLNQAVLGHPLLTFLSKDLVDLEIREFVVAHFKKSYIKDLHLEALQKALVTLEQSETRFSEDVFQTLSQLNLPPGQTDEFILEMQRKYGEQFIDFIPYLQQRFDLTKGDQRCHIFNFYPELQELLPYGEDKVSTDAEPQTSVADLSLFSPRIPTKEANKKTPRNSPRT